MADEAPVGCLGMLLGLLGIRPGAGRGDGESLPYRLRDDFLSPAEYSFYRVLLQAAGTRAVICPKVRLSDLIFVAGGEGQQKYRNQIDRKHLDFVLCDPERMRPWCGVELDDRSHDRRDRRERDELVDRAMAAAGLPLVRVKAQRAYSPAELWQTIEQAATAKHDVEDESFMDPPSSRRNAAQPKIGPPGPPLCSKCGVPMVERRAARGPRAGRMFFGCPNYPRCQETQDPEPPR